MKNCMFRGKCENNDVKFHVIISGEDVSFAFSWVTGGREISESICNIFSIRKTKRIKENNQKS